MERGMNSLCDFLDCGLREGVRKPIDSGKLEDRFRNLHRWSISTLAGFLTLRTPECP